ncbi:DUF1297 domain-containing protein [Candidatus Woesearchaeota archaeon]|nr:DUF1297 domain-containing protein [Candidatus Woesearchaeota archaeon]
MITPKMIEKVLEGYDTGSITIGVLGGHSALDVCRGAKKHGFRTLVVCQKGREKTYAKYFRSRDDLGVVDETIILDKFSDLLSRDVQQKLREKNTIFIHSRYFWVYFNFRDIEDKFLVPIYGSRELVKFEERDVPKNQYYILRKAGIRTPKVFSSPRDIDRLVLVKASETARGYERAFFFANSYDDYVRKSKELLQKRVIDEKGLKKAIIEEYVLGAQVNFNFFYSNLTGELELMGTDTRRQTNLDGILRIPAAEQIEVLKYITPKIIETGHCAVTIKESLLEKAFEAGERFVAAVKKTNPPGIMGPFALQGAIAAEEGREEIVIFDVSMRIPGSPGTMFTPYSAYLHLEPISYGERIAMEIRKGIDMEKLHTLCT